MSFSIDTLNSLRAQNVPRAKMPKFNVFLIQEFNSNAESSKMNSSPLTRLECIHLINTRTIKGKWDDTNTICKINHATYFKLVPALEIVK